MATWLKLPFGETPAAPPLIGERVYLRPPRPGDWRAWADLRLVSREFLTPWEPTWPREALSRGAFRHRLRRNARDWRSGHAYGFLMFRLADNGLIGGITISNVRRGVAQCCSFGYWVGKPHAQQGYMSEGVQCALDFAFDTLAMQRVEAACLPANEASRRLLLRGGFTLEGMARAYLRINGSRQDHLLFGILRGDPRPGSGKPGAGS